MNIENIIDYVNETPYNTNIGILRNKLELYNKEVTKDTVKSVNGILPDDQGNVEIAYNDLEDKPFEEKVSIITIADFVASGKTMYAMGFDDVYDNLTEQLDSYVMEAWSSNRPYIYENAILTVIFDGIEYETTAISALDPGFGDGNTYTLGFGNVSMWSPQTESNDYPFALYCGATPKLYVNDTEEHVVIISYGEKTIKSLDPKFLPEGYPYVKTEMGVLMPEETVAFQYRENAQNFSSIVDIAIYSELIEGQTYTVNFDGVSYECVCSRLDGELFIGNLSVVIPDETDTGEPFLCGVGLDYLMWTTKLEGSEHTISVMGEVTEIVPMAPEFLPAMPLFVSLVCVYSNDSTIYYCSESFDDLALALDNGRAVIATLMELNYSGYGNDRVTPVNYIQSHHGSSMGNTVRIYFGIKIYDEDFYELCLESDGTFGIAQPK